MLSNCVLAAAASTSRLVCARRTFASLVQDSTDHEVPVLPTAPPTVSRTRAYPTDNSDDNLARRMRIIASVTISRSLLNNKQRRFLETVGLTSSDTESALTRELDPGQLKILRHYFSAHVKATESTDPHGLPTLGPKLRKALRNAASRATKAGATAGEEPISSPLPVKDTVGVNEVATAKEAAGGERRGRIRPTASPGRIKWDAPESISPFAASQLRERSRHDIVALKGAVLADIEPVNEMRPIARLAHGLDRALFNPGVNWLQDPRSRVFNYDPWLQKIPNVRDFAFERLPGFVKSSRDEDLWNLSRREGRKFAGSTSSLSGMLCHIYFLLSRDRHVDLSTLSRHMHVFPETFTPGQRMPATVILRHKDGVYATDSDSLLPGSAETNVLSWMGTMLEKFLTTEASTFSRYMRDSPNPAGPDTDNRREAYRYSMSPKMVMRSQLDAVDPRLPGRGVFDIKTRAAMSVRYDSKNWVENAGYLIRQLHGVTESFEREYCDLIRAAFLKYSFQARIGAMDGVMVAYHNTARVFGFQYIPLEEMDARLYGAPERGERVFGKCVQVLELLLETATNAFPGKSVRLLAEKYELDGSLRLFVEPVADEEADAQIAENERSEHDEAVQLGEGVSPSEIVYRRIRKAKEAADAEERTKGVPIKMFTVQTSHFLDGQPVSADTAINEVEKDWSLKVTIERPAMEDGEIRKTRAIARRRQFRANFLPTGVSVSQMAERWVKEATISPASQATVPAFDPAHWAKADWKTKQVRELSRKGAEETRRLDEIDKEMGHKRLVPDWVQASGVSLPEVKQQVDSDKTVGGLAETSEADTTADQVSESAGVLSVLQKALHGAGPATSPDPPSLRAEDLESSKPPHKRRIWKLQPKREQAIALKQAVNMRKEWVRERMHEMSLAPKGEAHTREWDESDNLHRADTDMDKGTRPSPTHESSVKEWKGIEEKPLPGTKAAKDEEKP
ncbi:Pet127-domain-containing protein [Peniophora sp. CONT]|nr:Pet127-domain-containing protein [Peniophora sp. CONT]